MVQVLPQQIYKQFKIPLSEVSGLTIQVPSTGDKNWQLLAIADESFDIAFSGFNGLDDIGLLQFNHKKIPSNNENKKSNWEAIASDARGHLFILEEDPGAIYIYSPDGQKQEHVIALKIPKQFEFEKKWEKKANSRGEGLLLMKNGHIMVLKEKEPPLLMEFGPKGESPLGFELGNFLSPEQYFDMSADKSNYTVLNTWRLPIEDGSELARRPTDGKIFVLSDKMNALYSVDSCNNTGSNDECQLGSGMLFPDTLKKLEGLAFLHDDRFFVASDQDDSDLDDLYLIDLK